MLAGVFLCLLASFSFSSCGASVEDIPRLRKQLSSSDASKRNEAALALAGLGAKAQPAEDSLIRLLSDKNSGVKSSAAYALRAIDTPKARAALDKATKDSE